MDKCGRPTNKKGTWVKGEVRTGQSLLDSYEAFVQSGSRRKDLKNFDSVEFMPLHIKNNQENIPVIELYPPPQLHCGILGPASFEKNRRTFSCIYEAQNAFCASY